MFTVLDIAPHKKRNFIGGMLHRLAACFRGADIDIVQARAGNIKYFIVRTEPVRGRLDWNKIYKATGREAYQLIIPESVHPPAYGPVAAYDATEYLRRVFYNTVFSFLKKLPGSARDNIIGFYDPEAKAGDIASRLLRYAGVVKVVTEDTSKYELYADRAMERYGAGLIISDFAEALEKCNIIILPYGMSGCSFCPHNSIIFDIEGICGYTVAKECIRLPKIYTAEMPNGISEAVFAAALYERARVKEIGNIVSRSLMINGKKISIYNILDSPLKSVKRV